MFTHRACGGGALWACSSALHLQLRADGRMRIGYYALLANLIISAVMTTYTRSIIITTTCTAYWKASHRGQYKLPAFAGFIQLGFWHSGMLNEESLCAADRGRCGVAGDDGWRVNMTSDLGDEGDDSLAHCTPTIVMD